MSQRYKTLKEASDATIALFKSIGIRFPTVDLYKKNYKKDPMLPIDPRRYDDFTTWQAYAGKAEMVQKYSTIEEAIAANVVLFKKLGISTPTYELYKDNYKKDPRLPSDPRRYESFKTWNEYLGKGKPVEKYPTYKEAKAAAAALFKKLGINEPTVALYTEHYEKDPRLHADPREVFKKFRWINYLGKKEPIGKYKTLEEASTAIIALFEELGIEKPTRVLYRKHYKEDPKLPSAPEEYYSKFTTFAKFFGIEPIELYPTVKEASVAAISMFEELGITNPTSNDYVREYWNDPRLPSNPRRYYDDFISYSEFLGRGIVVDKYQTFEEAKVATDVIFKELGIIEPTRTQYAKYFKNDPKLPSNPFYTYHKPVDWPSYLGRKHFYSREVALVRAIKLLGSAEITEDEYRAICGLDERLPIQAVVYYGLNSWSEFVGLNFYATWQEASASACKIIPDEKKTKLGYQEYYKQNPLLHSNLDKYYTDFPGWDAFYGREVLKKYSLEEARKFCSDNNLWSRDDYKKLALVNKQLPYDPSKYYKFKSYREFLAIEYFNLAEVKLYCQDNRIKNMIEYKRHARSHARLKVHPNSIDGYKNAKDIFWEPTEYQPLIDVGLPVWADLVKCYCERLKYSVQQNRTRLVHYLLYTLPFIRKIGAVDTVAPFFERKQEQPSMEDYINTLPESQRNNSQKNLIIGFLKDVFEQAFYLEDEDTGERTPVPSFNLYRIPYLNVSIVSDSVAAAGTAKPELPYEYVVKARSHLIPEFVEEGGEQVRCENFRQLTVGHELNISDWYDVDESVIDRKDPDCVWRVIEKSKQIKGQRTSKVTVYQMWSPVRTIGLYCLLNLPTRGQQILWLDSGEADEFKLINKGYKSINLDEKVQLVPDFEWVKNDNPLAGSQKKPNLGVLHKNGDNIEMFTNTNKTGKPFVSPYIPTCTIPWIIRLRDWQSKYNPLKEPTRWTEVDFTTNKPSISVLKQRGTQCFLFRNPAGGNRNIDTSTFQPMKQNVFGRALAKVLYEIQEPDFPLAERSASSYTSKYTPHTMRVSLITALVLYGEVPLHILMKVVGHAQIIMTLHYTKIKHLDIVETLDAGEKRLLARSQDQKNALLMEDRIHNHKDELLIPVYSALHDPEWPKASIQFFDYGLCPYGSTRCSDGGLEREETKNSKTKTEYNPVPSGYLGCQNCFRCRHFVTGAPFVVGLIIKGNEISEAKQYVSNKMLDINAEIEALDEEIFLLEDSSKIVPPDVKMKQKRLNNLLESEQIRLDMLSCDFLSIFRLVDQSLQLLNKVASIDSKIPMIMNAPKLSISISEVSKHRALAEVCENAEIFLSANATTALPRRSQSLDKMLSNNNMQPQLFKLSEEMQLHVGNQITQLMLARLNGWGNINRVLDGELPLDLLGSSDDSDLVPLSEDIKALLEKSIKLEIKTDELI